MYKICLTSLKENSGSTSLGILLANYLAKEMRVALIENKDKDEFSTIKASFEEDGTFYLNNVHFIPSSCEYEPTEDVVIDIFGFVNFMDELNDSYDKVCMCIDGDISNIRDINEYVNETGTSLDLFLLGASKEQYEFFSKHGYKSVIVPDKKDNVLPYSLYTYFSIELRKGGLTPPRYDKNKVYEEIVWNYDPESEKKKKGGKVLGMFSKKKTKTEKTPPKKKPSSKKETKAETDDDIEEDEEDIQTSILQKGSGAITGEISFIDVPAPKEEAAEDIDKKKNKNKKKPKPEVDNSEIIAEKKKYQQQLENVKKQADKERKQQEKKLTEQNKLLAEKKKELEKAKKEAEESHYKATHDKLCGTYNRTAFDENSLTFKKFAIVMFDVNCLKQQNDELGHKAGDKLLKNVAKTLMDNIPEVYRYGGDEFVGVFRGSSIRDKEKIEEILKTINIELETLTKKDKKIKYSVARGVAFSSEGDLSKVLELADSRMYEHKRSLKIERADAVKSQPEEKPLTTTTKTEDDKQKKKSIFDSLRLKTDATPVNDVSHLNIFVTGISHSVGTSFVAGSISSAMTFIFNKEVWVDFNDNSDDIDNYMVKIAKTDDDRFNAFKSSFFVQDKGVFSLLSDADLGDMLRADINIMVSTAKDSDLKDLATFIKQNEKIISNWVFAFNHVTPTQEETIKKAMKNYNYVIIPFHDNAEISEDLKNMYINIINEFTR